MRWQLRQPSVATVPRCHGAGCEQRTLRVWGAAHQFLHLTALGLPVLSRVVTAEGGATLPEVAIPINAPVGPRRSIQAGPEAASATVLALAQAANWQSCAQAANQPLSRGDAISLEKTREALRLTPESFLRREYFVGSEIDATMLHLALHFLRRIQALGQVSRVIPRGHTLLLSFAHAWRNAPTTVRAVVDFFLVVARRFRHCAPADAKRGLNFAFPLGILLRLNGIRGQFLVEMQQCWNAGFADGLCCSVHAQLAVETEKWKADVAADFPLLERSSVLKLPPRGLPWRFMSDYIAAEPELAEHAQNAEILSAQVREAALRGSRSDLTDMRQVAAPSGDERVLAGLLMQFAELTAYFSGNFASLQFLRQTVTYGDGDHSIAFFRGIEVLGAAFAAKWPSLLLRLLAKVDGETDQKQLSRLWQTVAVPALAADSVGHRLKGVELRALRTSWLLLLWKLRRAAGGAPPEPDDYCIAVDGREAAALGLQLSPPGCPGVLRQQPPPDLPNERPPKLAAPLDGGKRKTRGVGVQLPAVAAETAAASAGSNTAAPGQEAGESLAASNGALAAGETGAGRLGSLAFNEKSAYDRAEFGRTPREGVDVLIGGTAALANMSVIPPSVFSAGSATRSSEKPPQKLARISQPHAGGTHVESLLGDWWEQASANARRMHPCTPEEPCGQEFWLQLCGADG